MMTSEGPVVVSVVKIRDMYFHEISLQAFHYIFAIVVIVYKQNIFEFHIKKKFSKWFRLF